MFGCISAYIKHHVAQRCVVPLLVPQAVWCSGCHRNTIILLHVSFPCSSRDEWCPPPPLGEVLSCSEPRWQHRTPFPPLVGGTQWGVWRDAGDFYAAQFSVWKGFVEMEVQRKLYKPKLQPKPAPSETCPCPCLYPCPCRSCTSRWRCRLETVAISGSRHFPKMTSWC